MCGDIASISSRDVELKDKSSDVGVDDVLPIHEKFQSRGIEIQNKGMKKEASESISPASRDTGGQSDGHSHNDPTNPGKSTPSYIGSITSTTTYKSFTKTLSVHTGVPTWKEEITEEYK